MSHTTGLIFMAGIMAIVVLLVYLTLWLIDPKRIVNRKGHCLHCGYSLTGNTSGVCPECGTAITPPCQSGDLSA